MAGLLQKIPENIENLKTFESIMEICSNTEQLINF